MQHKIGAFFPYQVKETARPLTSGYLIFTDSVGIFGALGKTELCRLQIDKFVRLNADQHITQQLVICANALETLPESCVL